MQTKTEEDVKKAVDILNGDSSLQFDLEPTLENFVYILKNISLVAKMTTSISKAESIVEQAEGIIEEYGRGYDHHNILCVNVKRYNDYLDISELLDKMRLSKNEREYLTERFDESSSYSLWDDFIYFNQLYIIDDFLKGCTLCGKKYWEEQIEKIKSGDKTDYPAIDKLKTNEEEIYKLKEWMKKDIKQKNYLDSLYVDEAGFYSRSGGWFGIEYTDHLENEISDINNVIDEFKDDDNWEGMVDGNIEYLQEMAEELKVHIDAIEWVLNWVKNYNENLSFQDEVKYRIEEALNEFRFNNMKKAKRRAKRRRIKKA